MRLEGGEEVGFWGSVNGREKGILRVGEG